MQRIVTISLEEIDICQFFCKKSGITLQRKCRRFYTIELTAFF